MRWKGKPRELWEQERDIPDYNVVIREDFLKDLASD